MCSSNGIMGEVDLCASNISIESLHALLDVQGFSTYVLMNNYLLLFTDKLWTLSSLIYFVVPALETYFKC